MQFFSANVSLTKMTHLTAILTENTFGTVFDINMSAVFEVRNHQFLWHKCLTMKNKT